MCRFLAFAFVPGPTSPPSPPRTNRRGPAPLFGSDAAAMPRVVVRVVLLLFLLSPVPLTRAALSVDPYLRLSAGVPLFEANASALSVRQQTLNLHAGAGPWDPRGGSPHAAATSSFSTGNFNATDVNWPFRVLVPGVDYFAPPGLPARWRKASSPAACPTTPSTCIRTVSGG